MASNNGFSQWRLNDQQFSNELNISMISSLLFVGLVMGFLSACKPVGVITLAQASQSTSSVAGTLVPKDNSAGNPLPSGTPTAWDAPPDKLIENNAGATSEVADGTSDVIEVLGQDSENNEMASGESDHKPSPTPTPANELIIIPFGIPFLSESDFSTTDVVGFSADGRYVLFFSMSTQLIDAYAAPDIPRLFLYDRTTGEVELVSAAADGTPADWWSFAGAMSSDGSTIAFWSFDTNLSSDKVLDCPQADSGEGYCGSLYIYDGHSETVERIPVGLGYGLGMLNETVLSSDGRFVAFVAFGGAIWDGTMLLDRSTGEITQVSTGGAAVDLSADGRFLAFVSDENELVAGDSNRTFDVFVFDRESGETERINNPLNGDETGSPSGANYFSEGISGHVDISPDGRFVVFMSQAPNLVEAEFTPCFTYKRDQLASCEHIYLHDRDTGVTELISLSQGGVPGDGLSSKGLVSQDGRWVVFNSMAGNLTDKGLIDCQGCAQGLCQQVFVRDRKTGRTHLLSMGFGGQNPNGRSQLSFLSPVGNKVIFKSSANNLTPFETSGIFVANLNVFFGE